MDYRQYRRLTVLKVDTDQGSYPKEAGCHNLGRRRDVPQVGDAGFSDIEGNTHDDAINALAASGITRGYGDGTFRSNQRTTRAQMAAFINRALTAAADTAGAPSARRAWRVLALDLLITSTNGTPEGYGDA